MKTGNEERRAWQGGSPWKFEVKTDTGYIRCWAEEMLKRKQCENELNSTLRAITTKYIQEPQVSCASESACYTPLTEQ
jgi:hypothetical protein